MANKTRLQILKYKFEDGSRSINSIIIGNLFFGILLVITDLSLLFTSPRAQICLLTSIVFLILQIIYDWKSQKVNYILLAVYLIAWFIEVAFLGIPYYPISTNHISMGFVVDVVISGSPSVYIYLRLLLVIPILRIIYLRNLMVNR